MKRGLFSMQIHHLNLVGAAVSLTDVIIEEEPRRRCLFDPTTDAQGEADPNSKAGWPT